MKDAFEEMKSDPNPFSEGIKAERISKEGSQPTPPNTDTPAGDGKQPPPPITDDHLKTLHEKTGIAFKDYDEIKSYYSKAQKADELSQKMVDYDQKMSQLKEQEEIISKFNDPLSYFADESEMKRQQLLIKYGKDMNRDVLGQITSDLSNVNDLKLAAMALQLENPKLTAKQAESLVREDIKVDADDEIDKFDELAVARLNVLANKARKSFKELNETIKIPEKFDVVAFKKQKETEMAKRNELLTSSWFEVLNKGAELAKGVKIPGKNDKNEDIVKFEFVFPDEFKKTIPEQAKELILEHGLDRTKENYNALMATIENRFILENLPKMFDAFEKDVVAREAKKVYDKKTHPSDDHEKGKEGDGAAVETDESKKVAEFVSGKKL